jgi:hypothetical protein
MCPSAALRGCHPPATQKAYCRVPHQPSSSTARSSLARLLYLACNAPAPLSRLSRGPDYLRYLSLNPSLSNNGGTVPAHARARSTALTACTVQQLLALITTLASSSSHPLQATFTGSALIDRPPAITGLAWTARQSAQLKRLIPPILLQPAPHPLQASRADRLASHHCFRITGLASLASYRPPGLPSLASHHWPPITGLISTAWPPITGLAAGGRFIPHPLPGLCVR